MGGYELGLANAVELAFCLAEALRIAHSQNSGVELLVAGRVAPDVQARWAQRIAAEQANKAVSIHWAGLVPRHQIPELDRSAHLLYSADLNAACPNAVIEALACGTPVAAFDTGALAELVTEEAGRIVPYGGDPWRLDRPDIPALAHAAAEILDNQPRWRAGARARAEQVFGLDKMVASYLQVLLDG
jgi:glycosyltransferase involved in cell wall biosynthesis